MSILGSIFKKYNYIEIICMCNDDLNNMVLIRLKFIVNIFIATVKQK